MNPWTNFNDLAFTTSPTIPAPNQGLGAAARVSITPNYYVLGGFADANGDPHDPGGSFETFFDDREYFEHIEFGWIGSWEKRFEDNIHVGAWHADRRDDAAVPDGWGVQVSASREFGERFLPFLRGGYADGAGALLEGVISTGLGYRVNERGDYAALGASWGRPPEESTGGRTEDQLSFEIFYRIQIVPQLAVTPALQYIENPALDSSVSRLGIFALRIRFVL